MIYYDKELKAFLLNGKTLSYVLLVNDAGVLQNAHFGGRVEKSDLPYLVNTVAKSVHPDDNDGTPSECGTYARGDYRDPTVIFERADGAAMTLLTYVKHEIYRGAPALEGLPCARRGGDTLSVTFKDKFSDTEVALNYTVWDDCDVIARNLTVKNNGKQPLKLKKVFSFCADLPEADYSVMRLHGTWAQERIPETTPLGYGITRIQSLRGQSSHQMNPFMAVLAKDCTENFGECYGAQLVYSGSFAITAERNANGSVRVQGGVSDVNFCWALGAGESFTAPQAALGYSCEGIGGLSRAYADFIRSYIISPEKAYMRRPILVNNWEATYFDFDNEKLFAIIDEAAKLGIDTFVLDDGWFGKRDDDHSGLGDWFVNCKKLKGGLKTVIDRCKSHNLKFGLWFEPEMISEDSDLFRAHPDWALVKQGVEPMRSRFQLVLDMTRKEVVDYVFGVVSKVLSENEISYVKWDMNRPVSEFFSSKLPADRQGEVAHRYILGVYDLAKRLTEAFPEVFFEGCAGGGGRFDAGMLYYFPQIWTSDDTDAYERTKIQWGTSTCYPVSAMSCHVSVCPNHQTQRITPFATRGVIASLGATGYELDLSKISEEDKRLTAEQVKAYKQIDELVLKGDLYRLSSPFTTNYFCMMLVSKDKKRAYVAGERFRGDPCDHDRLIRLTGLDGGKTYRVKELGITASGKTLINTGVFLPRLPDFGSWTWHIEEA